MEKEEDKIFGILCQVLNRKADKLTKKSQAEAHSKFLVKIPGLLTKFPSCYIGKFHDSEEDLLKKKRFTFWLIHKILRLKTQPFPENEKKDIHRTCSEILSFILKNVGINDQRLFRMIVEHLLILLHGKIGL